MSFAIFHCILFIAIKTVFAYYLLLFDVEQSTGPTPKSFIAPPKIVCVCGSRTFFYQPLRVSVVCTRRSEQKKNYKISGARRNSRHLMNASSFFLSLSLVRLRTILVPIPSTAIENCASPVNAELWGHKSFHFPFSHHVKLDNSFEIRSPQKNTPDLERFPKRPKPIENSVFLRSFYPLREERKNPHLILKRHFEFVYRYVYMEEEIKCEEAF